MNICDLSNSYTCFAKGEISSDEYMRSDKILFKHYLKYWGNKERPLVKLSEAELTKNRALVLRALDNSNKKLTKAGLSLSNIEIILFVGQGTSNGHAYLHEDQAVVWFPLETYTTKLRTEIFVLHELAHGLHYQSISDLFFYNKEEKDEILRMLVTEGVATYVSYLLGREDEKQALWADYLPQEVVPMV